MMLFEVLLAKGLGGPIYVDAEDADEAAKKAIGAYRKGCTAVDMLPISKVVVEARASNKKAVQYA